MSWQTVVLLIAGGILLIFAFWLIAYLREARKNRELVEKKFEEFGKDFRNPFDKR